MTVAGFESFIGLQEFAGAFDLHDAPLSFGQFVINARLAIHPFFAIAAFVLAARRYSAPPSSCLPHTSSPPGSQSCQQWRSSASKGIGHRLDCRYLGRSWFLRRLP
jgi:hypothetical protein